MNVQLDKALRQIKACDRKGEISRRRESQIGY
jgi:hypothetical protein